MIWLKEIFGIEKVIIVMCYLLLLFGDLYFNNEKGMDYVVEMVRKDLYVF